MKRDFDLVRQILRDIETHPPGVQAWEFTFDGFDPVIVQAHVVLLIDAGLVEGTVARYVSEPSLGIVSGLTWAGHDFLDAISDDTLWAKAKKTVIAPAGGVAFTVLLEWAKAEAKSRLGLPP